jgi:hypothetical protein
MLFEYVIRPLLRPIKELTTDFTVFRWGRRGGGAGRAQGAAAGPRPAGRGLWGRKRGGARRQAGALFCC